MRISMPTITALLLTFCLVLKPQYTSAQSTCEVAYSQLQECALPLDEENPKPAEGCCSLLAAFELRDCLNSDPRIAVLGEQVLTSLASLILNCQGEMFPDSRGDRAVTTIDDASSSTTTDDEATNQSSDLVIESIISLAQDAMGKEEPDYFTQQAVMYDQITLEFLDAEATCACTQTTLPVPDGEASWRVKLDYQVHLARLWLCQFTCNHCRLVLGGIVIQMTLLGLWIVTLLINSRANGHHRGMNSRRRSFDRSSSQFVVRASDYAPPDLECAQPLLTSEEKEYESDH